MASLLFFEKPGCATNARQKTLLERAGIKFEARSLLTEPWTRARLAQFFSNMPVAQWFNVAAPRIKSGEINPAAFNAESALTLMLAEPLLIRRPLLEHGDWLHVGFNWEVIASHFGIAASDTEWMDSISAPLDLEGCSHAHREQGGSCSRPVAQS